MCEVRNTRCQKYPSNRSQDTQNKLHSSSSGLDLIIDRRNKIYLFSKWIYIYIYILTDINFQQSPFNQGTEQSEVTFSFKYVFLLICRSQPYLHLLWRCGSSDNYEFCVISLHCNQRYCQKIHYC